MRSKDNVAREARIPVVKMASALLSSVSIASGACIGFEEPLNIKEYGDRVLVTRSWGDDFANIIFANLHLAGVILLGLATVGTMTLLGCFIVGLSFGRAMRAGVALHFSPKTYLLMFAFHAPLELAGVFVVAYGTLDFLQKLIGLSRKHPLPRNSLRTLFTNCAVGIGLLVVAALLESTVTRSFAISIFK